MFQVSRYCLHFLCGAPSDARIKTLARPDAETPQHVRLSLVMNVTRTSDGPFHVRIRLLRLLRLTQGSVVCWVTNSSMRWLWWLLLNTRQSFSQTALIALKLVKQYKAWVSQVVHIKECQRSQWSTKPCGSHIKINNQTFHLKGAGEAKTLLQRRKIHEAIIQFTIVLLYKKKDFMNAIILRIVDTGLTVQKTRKCSRNYQSWICSCWWSWLNHIKVIFANKKETF